MSYRAMLALALLATVLPSAWSQECVPGPGPSSLLKTSDAVFVGTVTAASAGAYRFHVTETFKGVNGDYFEVAGVPGTGFQIGKQYLVFASTLTLDNGTKYHIAHACGFTRELKYAQASLEQVRAEKSGQRVASVYGTLLRTFPETLNWDESYVRPLPGIVVRLRSGQKSYETKTDEYGVYAFKRIPPGTYEVSADLPPNLALWRQDQQ